MRKIIDVPSIPGIYQILMIELNKPYRGKAVNCQRRLSNHRTVLNNGNHYCPDLQTDWNKYGEGAFRFEIIVPVLNIPKEDIKQTLRVLEDEAIEEVWDYCYNQVKAGGGPSYFSEESLKRASTAQLLRFSKPGAREKAREVALLMHQKYPHIREAISLGNIERHKIYWTEENRKKQSIITTNLYKNDEYRQMHSDIQTQTWTDKQIRNKRVEGIKASWAEGTETRENRLQAMKRSWQDGSRAHQNKKPWSEERRKKASEAAAKAWADPEKRANIVKGLNRRGKGGNKPRQSKD